MYFLSYGDMRVPFDSRGKAIRGMARVVRGANLTEGERRAFERWYTNRNYRSVGLALWKGEIYELGVSIQGQRHRFRIEPPPPLPHEAPRERSVSATEIDQEPQQGAPRTADVPQSAPHPR